MMHTKTLPGKHGVATAIDPRPIGKAAGRGQLLVRLERWLMPWRRLRMRAADGGPPQWPMPWR
jgi:hypothetical protein